MFYYDWNKWSTSEVRVCGSSLQPTGNLYVWVLTQLKIEENVKRDILALACTVITVWQKGLLETKAIAWQGR